MSILQQFITYAGDFEKTLMSKSETARFLISVLALLSTGPGIPDFLQARYHY
jgi:hypothetical protein